MNTNSNNYTIIFATVMVVIVALLLALVSGMLSDKQTENVELDKKKQILTSLNINTQDQDVNELYNKYITKEVVIDSKGNEIENPESQAFYIDVKKELSKPLENRALPLYIADVDGSTKYIISLYGAGLWGPIWGYVALDEDKNTIFGSYYSHASETPGLGAEIADHHFQTKFIGKEIFNSQHEFVSVAIVKPGQTAERDYVDGISGGTITSNGVESMLMNCIGQYEQYLKLSINGGTEE
ncbi:MAG: NADH:ubiquinone reductase (Na(+)-transporting) subunit C [Bacteroidales bacterium 36-12]|nr:MAG: NADH:ubiquinone reductase (Na(+)-transporting) subunit C [Bacteroidales bacterium 36-12]